LGPGQTELHSETLSPKENKLGPVAHDCHPSYKGDVNYASWGKKLKAPLEKQLKQKGLGSWLSDGELA
jgi:hypothetical protein